jgi:heme exporter protein D
VAEFFSMGGYAFYVWTSYLVVLVLFVWHFFAPVSRLRRLMRELSLANSDKTGRSREYGK